MVKLGEEAGQRKWNSKIILRVFWSTLTRASVIVLSSSRIAIAHSIIHIFLRLEFNRIGEPRACLLSSRKQPHGRERRVYSMFIWCTVLVYSVFFSFSPFLSFSIYTLSFSCTKQSLRRLFRCMIMSAVGSSSRDAVVREPSACSSSLREMIGDDFNDANDLKEDPSSRHSASFKDACSSL